MRTRFLTASSILRKPFVLEGVRIADPKPIGARVSGSTCEGSTFEYYVILFKYYVKYAMLRPEAQSCRFLGLDDHLGGKRRQVKMTHQWKVSN